VESLPAIAEAQLRPRDSSGTANPHNANSLRKSRRSLIFLILPFKAHLA
jgi:hypothetical protein